METPRISHLRPVMECGERAADRDRQRMEELIEQLHAAASAEARMVRIEEKLDENLLILKR